MSRKEKKRAEFQLAALSILAAQGEMDSRALARAIYLRLGKNPDGRFSKWGYFTFLGRRFSPNMFQLEKEGSVRCISKRSPDPERDKALGYEPIAHYSITAGGGIKRARLLTEKGSRDRAKEKVTAGGVGKPAYSQFLPG